jgi:hypothetical protein
MTLWRDLEHGASESRDEDFNWGPHFSRTGAREMEPYTELLQPDLENHAKIRAAAQACNAIQVSGGILDQPTVCG